ncbi:bifunctional RNase H/acid phosphatase [Thermopolyspora sp. NPDC052614]|uniref:bifunctional RNase H/acid phosphatase n=1 Tax=Thermopolyspora sp. NPDC052614 TaxID=3155682 RepID=UPI003440DD29
MSRPASRYVIEADGGARGNPGPAGYGAVVKDAAGGVLAEAAEAIGTATNNVAEYRGLIAGLTALTEIAGDGATVEVRMDSKLVIEQMAGRWKVKHENIRPLATQAAALARRHRVTWRWVPRAENAHADRLANEAMDAAARGETWQARNPAQPSPSGPEAAVRDLRGTPTGFADEPGATGAPTEGPSGARRAVSRPDAGGRGSGTAAGRGPDAATGRGRDVAEPSKGTGRGGEAHAGRGVAGTTADSASTGAASTGVAPSGMATATRPGSGTGWMPRPTRTATSLLLLRHGETPLSVDKRFSGTGDPVLTAKGVAQAEAAAVRLSREPYRIDVIVTSPLKRALQTAEAVAARTGREVVVEEGLRETDFGSWEGHTFAEIQRRWPDHLTAWLADPSVAPPGGESFQQTAERVEAAVSRLIAKYPGRTILTVSHVTPIKTILRLALLAPPAALYRMHLDIACLSTVDYYADGPAVVRSVNDTSHLR